MKIKNSINDLRFPKQKSFKRESTYDWSQYNMLVLKVRGDGRSYLINLHCEGYFDLMWNDIYHFALYTRGGPHWQIAKVCIIDFQLVKLFHYFRFNCRYLFQNFSTPPRVVSKIANRLYN